MNNMTTLPATASVQDMQRNYRKLLDKVKATKEPLFVLRNNVAEAVIVDVVSWHKIAAKLAKKEENELEYSVKIYEKEKRQGKLKVLKGKLSELMV
jgi:PHD/YefM family antitoxin component YafN of YafNO toxin-antitoxin module